MYGSIELGGTKTLVGIGESVADLVDHRRVPTTSPDETLAKVVETLADRGVVGVGVACFGPLELREGRSDWGHVGVTPKSGWSGAAVAPLIRRALGVPVMIDTDVNGAALGEGRWGAGQGLADFVYITVGTGIGGGAVVRGSPVHGLSHPEMGHIAVERLAGDLFDGLCPFHGGCLEGMASGPALGARFGPHRDWRTEEVLPVVTHYLVQGLRNIVYTLSPQRVIVGGGVSKMEGFHHALKTRLIEELANYPSMAAFVSEDFVVAPELGDLSGLAGGLVLASQIGA